VISRTVLVSLQDRSRTGFSWWYVLVLILWGFKSEGGLEPNAYTHALFADFDLAGQK
jgi:hypothetical protein